MKKNLIVLLVAIVAIGIVGGGIYYYQSKKTKEQTPVVENKTTDLQKAKESTSTPAVTKEETKDRVAGMSTYTSEKFGFSFSYPKYWGTVKESSFTETFYPERKDRSFQKGEKYFITFSDLRYDSVVQDKAVSITMYTSDFQVRPSGDMQYPGDAPQSLIKKADLLSYSPEISSSTSVNGIDMVIKKPILYYDLTLPVIDQDAYIYKKINTNIDGLNIGFRVKLDSETALAVKKLSTPVPDHNRYLGEPGSQFFVDLKSLSSLKDNLFIEFLNDYNTFLNSFKFN